MHGPWIFAHHATLPPPFTSFFYYYYFFKKTINGSGYTLVSQAVREKYERVFDKRFQKVLPQSHGLHR